MINTITSVLIYIGANALPYEASQGFNQQSLFAGLNAKLRRSTDLAVYNRLSVEMINTKKKADHYRTGEVEAFS